MKLEAIKVAFVQAIAGDEDLVDGRQDFQGLAGSP